MDFHDVVAALRALEDPSLDNETHEKACDFLASLDEKEEARDLVKSLESEKVSVRWDAANILAGLGIQSICAILKALMDPNRVGHPRLREGVLHVYHELQDPELKAKMTPLIESFRGPAPDITSMWVAYRILETIDDEICGK